jgi:hypothetical protein
MLDEAQEALLVDLVEADRSVPRHERLPFYLAETLGPPGVQIIHNGWRDQDRRVPKVDLQTLASSGLLQGNYERGTQTYFVTNAGIQRYEKIKRAQGQPIERVQHQVRNYFNGERFNSRHPGAFKKWQEAEELLWKDGSEGAFTTIGHLCREAMQEFGTSLLRHQHITPRETDPAKIVDRIRQFLDARKPESGASHAAFLDALLVLWGTVSDLVQRQEHGAQKQGEPLGWEDGRLCVFHVMVVMFELDALAPPR